MTSRSINGPQVRSLVRPAVTGSDGRFELRGVGHGRIVGLLLEGPGIESAKVLARTEDGEKVELSRQYDAPNLGTYVYHPAEVLLVAGPSAPISGVVRDQRTGRPLAGVTVKSQARHGERINGWGQDFVRAVSDAQGRYRLEGMPIGSDNRIAAIGLVGEVPYLSMAKDSPTASEDRPLAVDFDLRPGVWIEGRVTDRRTGKGLSGWVSYFVSQDNPDYGFARTLRVDERDRWQAGDDGRFRIAALPGPGFVTFMAHRHQEYSRRYHIEARWHAR